MYIDVLFAAYITSLDSSRAFDVESVRSDDSFVDGICFGFATDYEILA